MRPTRLNFVLSPAPRGGWRIAVLTIGVLALSWAGLRLISQTEAIAAIESQLISVQPTKSAIPKQSAARQRELEAQEKIIADAVRQLNLPIAKLIKTLRPPRDIRVALLGLDLGSTVSANAQAGTHTAGILKISAEARTPQDMTTYAAFLGDQSLFSSVYLVKHEINVQSPERPYRFLLEANWRE